MTEKEIIDKLFDIGGKSPAPFPGDLPDSLQDIFKDYEQNPARTNDNGDSREKNKGSVEDPFKDLF